MALSEGLDVKIGVQSATLKGGSFLFEDRKYLWTRGGKMPIKY